MSLPAKTPAPDPREITPALEDQVNGESERGEWVVVDTSDASSGEGEEEEANTTTLGKEDKTNKAVVNDGGEKSRKRGLFS